MMSNATQKPSSEPNRACLQFVNETKLLLEESSKEPGIGLPSFEDSLSSSGEDIWPEVSEKNTSNVTKIKPGKKTRGRVRIKMEFIKDKVRRYTTFSKRKTGIMKKAYELAQLTGTQLMLLVASETGHVYTFATKKLQPMITSPEGKALIEACLSSDSAPPSLSSASDETLTFNRPAMKRNIDANKQSEVPSKKFLPAANSPAKEVNPPIVPMDLSKQVIPCMPESRDEKPCIFPNYHNNFTS